MMQTLEKLLKDRGCPKVNLQVRADNAPAIEFYKIIGYDVEDAISLGKRLIED
jgi:ribosomal protein S18 acetylase RimI-like enzyme